MARPKKEKSEARWRDYAADHYFHYFYRYGEDEMGAPLVDDHRKDDRLELAAQPVKDLLSYKHYKGGVTTSGVGATSATTSGANATPRIAAPRARRSTYEAGMTFTIGG